MAPTHLPVPSFPEPRGLLRVVEFDGLPFSPRRVFTIAGATDESARADHIPTCEEFLFMGSGSCSLLVGSPQADPLTLTVESPGIHVEAGTWRLLTEFTPDAVVVVLASLPYRETTYL